MPNYKCIECEAPTSKGVFFCPRHQPTRRKNPFRHGGIGNKICYFLAALGALWLIWFHFIK